MDLNRKLLEIILTNPDVATILSSAEKLGLPNWYLGAGGITQTVWNYFHKYLPTYGIKDYDLIYFDNSDLSHEAEDKVIKRGLTIFDSLSVPVDLVNEARVHMWYKDHSGFSIPPYTSSEDAIDSWPSTATAIGITKIGEQLKVYTPFGLTDLFSLIVRPNKARITKEIYQKKVNRWQKLWPKLNIIPWD